MKPPGWKEIDELYSRILCLRSMPVSSFMSSGRPIWVLPITSINEDRLLSELGLPRAERDQIEGLENTKKVTRRGSTLSIAEELSSRAIIRLAANPPPEVGRMQRRTAERLLRPYPLGLRFSGNNMSPLPAWLAGAQNVALNMSHNDLAVQLHFALFNGSSGFVLKPPEMRAAPSTRHAAETSGSISLGQEGGEMYDRDSTEDSFWPPPRESLHRTSIEILSLHNLPKVPPRNVAWPSRAHS